MSAALVVRPDGVHLSIHVGPLAQNEARVVRGKIYLFKGSKEDALTRYQADFRGKAAYTTVVSPNVRRDNRSAEAEDH